MKYKDTLELYDELIAGGCTESQARVQAKQLGATGNILDEIKNELYWMRLIGAAMTIAFFSNILIIGFGK